MMEGSMREKFDWSLERLEPHRGHNCEVVKSKTTGVEHLVCHDCKESLKKIQPCEVYSRVVGYLRPVKQWNKGKKEEFGMRKTYKLEE